MISNHREEYTKILHNLLNDLNRINDNVISSEEDYKMWFTMNRIRGLAVQEVNKFYQELSEFNEGKKQ